MFSIEIWTCITISCILYFRTPHLNIASCRSGNQHPLLTAAGSQYTAVKTPILLHCKTDIYISFMRRYILIRQMAPPSVNTHVNSHLQWLGLYCDNFPQFGVWTWQRCSCYLKPWMRHSKCRKVHPLPMFYFVLSRCISVEKISWKLITSMNFH